MNGEIYDPWTPPELGTRTSLAFDAMRLDGGTLVIELHSQIDKGPVSLCFSPLPLLVKIVNESHRLVSLSRLPKKRMGSLYLVQNSEVLRDFNAESLGIYASDPIFHLALITDEWIDLILGKLPTVRIKS